MATRRISASYSSPTVSFYLDADVIQTAPAGTSGRPYGGWKIRAYLRMSKATLSWSDASGTQSVIGDDSNKAVYSRDPFLPQSLTSWNEGPYDFWVNANSQGYWSGTSTSYPLGMRLTYGSVNDRNNGSITLPRIIQKPSSPTTPGVTRVSDTQQNLSWTRNASSAAPYTSQQVQRRSFSDEGWSSFVTIATIGTDYTSSGSHSYSDKTTKANAAYQYRIRALNGAGEAVSGISVVTYTTPATPTSLTAKKQATGAIRLDVVTSTTVNSQRTELRYSTNGGSTWTALTNLASNVTTYTWENPPSVPSVIFDARTVIESTGSVGNGLGSGRRVSNAIVLTAPPAAPTNLAPNGLVFDAETENKFSWKFNTGDSADQTAYEIQYRIIGPDPWTSTGKISSTEEFHWFLTDTFQNGNTYQWQVRTWGVHADPSPWSATGTFITSRAPSVSVTFPGDTVDTAKLTPTWSYYDPEGTAQSQWEARLYREGLLVETRSGSGTASSVAFSSTLLDATEYQVQVRVRDGSGLWSGWDQKTFMTDFPTPEKPELSAEWQQESGFTLLNVTNPDIFAEDVTNLFTNPNFEAGAGTVEVRRNLVRNPDTSDASGWIVQGGGGATVVSEGGRLKYTAGTHGSRNGGSTDLGLSYPAGTYTVSFNAQAPDGGLSGVRTYLYSNTSGAGVVATGTKLVEAGGEDTRYSFTVTASGSFNVVYMEFYGSIAAGTVGYISKPLLEVGDRALPFFRPGFPSPDPGLTPSWTGTANASPSVLTGVPASSIFFSSTQGITWQSQSDGVRTLKARIADGVAAWGLSVSAMPGGLLTFVTRVKTTWTGTIRIRNGGTTAQEVLVPVTAGVWKDVHVAADGAGGANTGFVGRPGDGWVGGQTFEVEHLALVAGTYTGPFFSGDSAGAVWNGTPNASTSTLKALPQVVTNIIQRSLDGGETWEDIAEAPENGQAFDITVPLVGEVLYRVEAWSALPSATLSDEVLFRPGYIVVDGVEVRAPMWGYWSVGEISLPMKYGYKNPPKIDMTTGAFAKTLHYFAGRTSAVETMGEAIEREGSVEFMVGSVAYMEQARSMALLPAPHLFRLPDGTYVFASISPVKDNRVDEGFYEIGFKITEVVQ